MSGSTETFDPFASAGWSPVPAPDAGSTGTTLRPVIDVGGPDYSPAITPGEPGSQFQRVPDTPRERANFQDAMRNLLGEPLPPRTAPSSGATAKPKTKAAEAETFDPFAAAGLTKATAAPKAEQPAAASPATIQELRNQPWHQPLTDAIMSTVGGLESVSHGASMGLDDLLAPLVPALAKSHATGMSFSKAYDEAVAERRQVRHEFERNNPGLGTVLEVAGSIPTTVATAPLFGEAATGAGLGARALTAGRNVAASAGLGAVQGAGMTEGDLATRAEGARQGAEVGGALGGAAPVLARTARNVVTGLTPGLSVDRIAGEALRERAGLGPHDVVPPPAPSPLPGMPMGAGAAMNNPGLAAEERLLNATDDRGALAVRTAQNQALRNAATGVAPPGARLAYPMDVPEASGSVVTAMQRAREVLRTEEERLWTNPALTGLQPDVAALQARVRRTIAALPARFQQALTRSGDVSAALDDLYNLPANASLADINHVRSDILAASRGLPFSERFARRAADDAAGAVLHAIESNPAMRANPTARVAYQRARDFTRSMWDALDKPQFQRMLQATEGNRKGIDPGTLASGMFNFTRGSERTPEGVASVIDMLDGVRRQWGALATGAGGTIPGLNPAAAFAARAELGQGTRDFIINSMLNSAESSVRDQAGRPNLMLNRLSDWIDTNRAWIGRSRLFNPRQLELLDRVREAAVMASRTENLRGGAGSPTFERLKGDRYVDVFLGPLLGRTVGATTGIAVGTLAAHLFGEAGIGGLIGAELGGAAGGHTFVNPFIAKLYAAPRARLLERVHEAIRDPVIADDLMRGAGASVSPATKVWLRSVLAIEPAGQAARAFGGEHPEFGGPTP